MWNISTYLSLLLYGCTVLLPYVGCAAQSKVSSQNEQNLLIGALLHSDWWCHMLCSTPSYIYVRLCATKSPIMAVLCSTPSYIGMDCVPQSHQSWLHFAILHLILTWNCVPQWPIMTPLCNIQFCVKATHLYTPNITCKYLLPQESEISNIVNCLAFKIHCVKWTSNCENNWRGCGSVHKTTTTAPLNCGEPPKLQVKKAAFWADI